MQVTAAVFAFASLVGAAADDLPAGAADKTEKTEPKKKPSSPSSPSSASSSSSSVPPLQEAEAALRAGIHKRCVELAQEALATGLLDEDGVARAWWTRGRCHSIDGDKDRAERSYAVAVRVKPNILMPVDDAAFSRVKAEGTAPETALTLGAAAVVVAVKDDSGAAAAFVAVDVAANDDLALGRTFLLVNSDEREVARAPIERKEGAVGDEWTKVKHRFSGIPVEGLEARLLDKSGNVLRRAAVVVDDAAKTALLAAGATPQTPPSTSLPTTTTEPTALSYVGAGVSVAGLLGAGAAGIAFAFANLETDDHRIDTEVPLLIGFGAATAAVVVGGALVVVDQLPPG